MVDAPSRRCVAAVGSGVSATAEAIADAEAVGRLLDERATADLSAGLGAASPLYIAPSAADTIEWIAQRLAPASGVSR